MENMQEDAEEQRAKMKELEDARSALEQRLEKERKEKEEQERRAKQLEFEKKSLEEQEKARKEEEKRKREEEWRLKQDLVKKRSEAFRRQLIKAVGDHLAVDFKDDIFSCHGCGHTLGKTNDAVNIPIRDAFKSWEIEGISEKSTLLVQEVGYKKDDIFHVIILKASSIESLGSETRPPRTNWFKGCNWNHAYCPGCKVHKGWINRSVESCAAYTGTFYELCLKKF